MPLPPENTPSPKSGDFKKPDPVIANMIQEDTKPDRTINQMLLDLNEKISEALLVLQLWDAASYTGMFIDAHPERRKHIDGIVTATRKALKKFGILSVEEREKGDRY